MGKNTLTAGRPWRTYDVRRRAAQVQRHPASLYQGSPGARNRSPSSCDFSGKPA
jgi:hypothetical protein